MKKVAEFIYGYTYGSAEVATSPVTIDEFNALKVTVGFSDQDHRYLQLAGEVLADQTKQIVDHWRNEIIAGIPNLAKHSQNLHGYPIPKYAASSGLRFQQWILDTCLRPYDQDWINYQHEIALRHTAQKKNHVDQVYSTAYVPFRDVIAFIAVMNDTMKSYLAGGGHSAEIVDKMHRAWCRSIQLQLALWANPYTDKVRVPNEW